MPYRIEFIDPPPDAFDRLVTLGALDIESTGAGLLALMPDSVDQGAASRAVGAEPAAVSPAIGRDDDSVWILSQRPVRAGRVLLLPEHARPEPGALRLADRPAFGTGLHPTTALCLETMTDWFEAAGAPDRVLDVGTGSGVLALAALGLGARIAIGLDLEWPAALAAKENARLNELGARLHLVQGGLEAVRGTFPFVVANILAAPLMEVAPLLVRVLPSGGGLLLSGIPDSMAADVEGVYVRLGMRAVERRTDAGWAALTLRTSW